jgi:hypothetical protein
MHDPPHVEMLGAIVLDEHVALVIADVFVKTQVGLVDRRIGGQRIVLQDRGRKQLVMPGQPSEIIVPGDDPQGIGLVPMDRVLVANASVIGIGVGDDIGGEHVVLDRGAHNPSSVSNGVMRSRG